MMQVRNDGRFGRLEGMDEETRSGPFPYYRHSNGPRTTTQTLAHVLDADFHLGVVASTDDHLGCPGA